MLRRWFDLRPFVRAFRWPWRRPKAFVSSTSLDLREHRLVVAETLRTEKFDVVTMDRFPAMAEAGAPASSKMVRRCDVFFGIYARRYGTRAPDGRSVTEHEYDAAAAAGLPRICFVLRETAGWPPEYEDTAPDRMALEALRARIFRDVVVGWFSDLQELRTIAADAAGEHLRKEQRRLWRRFAAAVVCVATLAGGVVVAILLAGASPTLVLEGEYPAPEGEEFAGVAADSASETIATVLTGGRVLLWDHSSKPREVARVDGGGRRLEFLDSNTLAIVGGPHVVACDVRQGRVLWRHSEDRDLMDVAAASGRVAVGTATGVTVILDRTGRLLQRLPAPVHLATRATDFGLVKELDFAPDGRRLVVAYLNGPLAIADVERGFERVIELEGGGSNSAVMFPNDRNIVLSHQRQLRGTEFMLSALDPDGAVTEPIATADNIFWSLASLSPRRIVSADWNGRIAVWDLQRKVLLAEYLVRNPTGGPEGLIGDLTVGPAGRVLAVTGERLVRLREEWRTFGNQPLGRLQRFIP